MKFGFQVLYCLPLAAATILHGAETENLLVHGAPAPNPIAIDGNLDEWDHGISGTSLETRLSR